LGKEKQEPEVRRFNFIPSETGCNQSFAFTVTELQKNAETCEGRDKSLTGQTEIEQDNENTYSFARKLNRTAKKPTRVSKSLTRVPYS